MHGSTIDLWRVWQPVQLPFAFEEILDCLQALNMSIFFTYCKFFIPGSENNLVPSFFFSLVKFFISQGNNVNGVDIEKRIACYTKIHCYFKMMGFF